MGQLWSVKGDMEALSCLNKPGTHSFIKKQKKKEHKTSELAVLRSREHILAAPGAKTDMMVRIGIQRVSVCRVG